MIYLIANVEQYRGLVKIGFTERDAQKRVVELQTGASGKLEVLWTCDGPREYETFLHNEFANKRVSGEWFNFRSSNPIIRVTVALKPFGVKRGKTLPAGTLLYKKLQYADRFAKRVEQLQVGWNDRTNQPIVLCPRGAHEFSGSNIGISKIGIPFCEACIEWRCNRPLWGQ